MLPGGTSLHQSYCHVWLQSHTHPKTDPVRNRDSLPVDTTLSLRHINPEKCAYGVFGRDPDHFVTRRTPAHCQQAALVYFHLKERTELRSSQPLSI